MLLSFRVKNFRSFADEAIFSMRPVNAYKEFEQNLCEIKRINVLKVAGIYGPNASGKSNVIRAIGAMRHILFDSLRRSSVDKIDVEPFELNSINRSAPTEFDIEMIIDNYVYRYGFSVTRDSVVAEWLYRSLGGQRVVSHVMFIREGKSILEFNKSCFNELKKSFDIETLLPNALLLPRLDQYNNRISKRVMGWFKNLNVLSGISSSKYGEYSARNFQREDFQEKMLSVIKLADSTIKKISIKTEEISADELPFNVRMRLPQSLRGFLVESRTVSVDRLDSEGCNVPFDLDDQESEGTKKLFEMSGPLVDILNKGSVLVIDELEAKLHPSLTRKIVSLFQSKDWNPNNAQLIFVTHEVTLLRRASLRRDQIWFCEKGRSCKSELYCLAEVQSTKRTRSEDNLEKKYLEGRFGAIPNFV